MSFCPYITCCNGIKRYVTNQISVAWNLNIHFAFSGVEIQETNNEYNLEIGDSCGFPGSPRNGSAGSAVMLYRPGEEATFTCQEGFVLFGPDKRTCRRNGTWSDTIPECRKLLQFIILCQQLAP